MNQLFIHVKMPHSRSANVPVERRPTGLGVDWNLYFFKKFKSL